MRIAVIVALRHQSCDSRLIINQHTGCFYTYIFIVRHFRREENRVFGQFLFGECQVKTPVNTVLGKILCDKLIRTDVAEDITELYLISSVGSNGKCSCPLSLANNFLLLIFLPCPGIGRHNRVVKGQLQSVCGQFVCDNLRSLIPYRFVISRGFHTVAVCVHRRDGNLHCLILYGVRILLLHHAVHRQGEVVVLILPRADRNLCPIDAVFAVPLHVFGIGIGIVFVKEVLRNLQLIRIGCIITVKADTQHQPLFLDGVKIIFQRKSQSIGTVTVIRVR